MQREAVLSHYNLNHMDVVAGHNLQLTSNADQSRTLSSIYMHENKLYVMEATVPSGYPEPGLFQQSLGWLDENWLGLRYVTFYSNGVPTPARAGEAVPRKIRAGSMHRARSRSLQRQRARF
jgi:hypothetical protein